MSEVLIIYHANKPEAVRRAQETARWLRAHGYGVVLTDQQTVSAWSQLPDPNIALILTLGGDGTLLTGALLGAPAGVPILGVHLGRFGFIAQAEPEEIQSALERWREGNYTIQERLMVRATIENDPKPIYALNEVALLRQADAPMLNFTIRINNLWLTTYPADGSLVATPTGSTAYALSVGAPVVHPQTEALILAPISPHTLGARPLVLPPSAQIAITVEGQSAMGSGEREVGSGEEKNAPIGGVKALLSADGRRHYPLELGQTVQITSAPFRTKLLSFNEGEFFQKLRERLLWGVRVNE